ncbi:TPA: Lrp/AsnC family transcriptional regulator [Candidatus Bathyarchaeota archaeon]|nr:Lrp/AsnC family transcriptional regulator [Candidatus Bathyarchaeota archaeon]
MFEKKDLLLLRELMKDSRQKITDLAKKCGLTRQSVYEKIKEFSLKGVKFTADVDPRDVGLNLTAYVLIVADPHTEFRRQTDAVLKKFREVSQVHYILGRFDVIAEVIVKDIGEFRRVLTKIQNLPAVRKTETLMVYETPKRNRLDPMMKAVEEQLPPK